MLPSHITCIFRVTRLLSCLIACGLPLYSSATEPIIINAHTRLGNWLSQQIDTVKTADSKALSDPYFPGIIWQVPAELEVQEREKRRLLTYIQYWSGDDGIPAKASREGMVKLISAHAATGRVPLQNADPRWLQANPQFDPVLEPGHQIAIPSQRPTTVAVIRENGTLCHVSHIPNLQAIDYIRTCDIEANPDQAWIIQPDGMVQSTPVALWNRSEQEPPAPGAWIWAPNRNSHWHASVSTRVAAFFATQGIADSPNAPPLTPLSVADTNILNFVHARDLPITASDWGTIGLLQTPTARMAKQGHASLTVAHVYPYSWLNVMLQPLDWLEFGFRYMDISNRPYGRPSLSGNQSFKDKSIDFKLRLLKESFYIPELALGMRDIGGTGLFSGEYLVASKRAGDFDFSLGLGWGYLGARGDIGNPFGWFSKNFKNRPQKSNTAGGINTSYFRGPIALFGGIQYHTPWDNLILKFEYEGNNYKNEPFSNTQQQRIPVNFGIVWRATPNFDLAAGYERGNKAMLSITFHGGLNNISVPKLSDPPSLPVSKSFPQKIPDWEQTAHDIATQTGWTVDSIRSVGSEVLVVFADPNSPYVMDHIERASTVLHRDAPASINFFRFAHISKGMPVGEHTTRRDIWVAMHTRPITPSEKRTPIVARPPVSEISLERRPEVWKEEKRNWFDGGLGFGYRQNLGGPDGFFLYQLSALAEGEIRLRKDTWLAGSLQLGLIDNYDKFKYTAPSNLPRVRTHIREYLTSSKFKIPNLQLTHTGKIGQDQYYSVYGGLLESMYAGIGAEWLYRPWGSPLAIGVDINQVKQRGFDQDFSLRSYQTTTGHITAYWNTGWNDIQINLSAGQYLAKDKGITLDVSRIFKNGVKIGTYATKTNISSATFGEGSFDKGIYISIPFDAFLTKSSTGTANIVWAPLIRDGGAKLIRQIQLYDLTNIGDPRAVWYEPSTPQR